MMHGDPLAVLSVLFNQLYNSHPTLSQRRQGPPLDGVTFENPADSLFICRMTGTVTGHIT